MVATHHSPRARRRFKRRTVRVLVDYYFDGHARYEYATTLGSGGLFIECEQPLELDARLKLRFRLGTGGPLHEIDGRVVWAGTSRDGDKAPGMGIEFTDAAAAAAVARELERIT
jgi:Tfp pilus assembly protein PilZ